MRLDNAVGGDVPLPEGLVVDLALRQRLEKAVARESKRSCCSCKYLGLQTDTGYEPDPVKWQLASGWKSHQYVLIEFLHVRDALANKPHRACVRANDFVYKCRAVPANPLNTSASRSLWFSMEFMDAFAENKLKGMKFRGVCYDNPVPSSAAPPTDRRSYPAQRREALECIAACC